MPGPPPAVAAARVAVRRWLEGAALRPGAEVLVGCSGGADSLALVAATAFVAPRVGLRVGVVVVDHGLQEGSAQVASRAAEQCRELLRGQAPPQGATPGVAGGDRDAVEAHGGGGGEVTVVPVTVATTGAGPEADARAVRHAALRQRALDVGAAAVLLGHTRDDQAEQVLLGLSRGSGARSLAGMRATRTWGGRTGRAALEGDGADPGDDTVDGPALLLGRPFLGHDLGRGAAGHGVTREQTRQVCRDLDIQPWEDPHNRDERFARVRARRALTRLEDVLGPGLATNLARTADLLQDDADALDALAETAYRQLGEPPWAVDVLTDLPRAVRRRVWRRAALAAGTPGTDLTSEHLGAVDALVTSWRGQGPVHLPGGVRASRTEDGVWLGREA